MNDTVIPMRVINRDAKVTITIGTDMIERVQLALSTLLDGRDTTDLATRITAGTATEPWEQSVVALSSLLQHIYQVAETAGQTTTRDFDIMSLS